MKKALALLFILSALAGCLGGGDEIIDPPDLPDDVTELCPLPCSGPLDGQAKDWIEYEPSIAINPTDPDNIIVGVHDDPGFESDYAVGAMGIPVALTPGFFGLSVSTSHDGGETWGYQFFPYTSTAEPDSNWNLWCNAGDPVVVFDPDGTAYYFGLGVGCSDIALAGATSYLFVTKSTDGGDTWSEPIIIWQAPGAVQFQDKQWAAVDPETGHISVSWNGFTACANGVVVFQCGSWDLLYSVSTDGAETWSDVPSIVTSGGTAEGFADTPYWDEQPMNYFSVPAWSGDGAAHISYRACGGGCIRVASSTDGGETWEKTQLTELFRPSRSGNASIGLTYTVIDADRSGGMHDGRIYVSYHNAPNGTDAADYDLMVQWSDDQGKTWSEPMALNDNPADGTDQHHHWMDVDEQGIVHAMFFDRRVEHDNISLAQITYARYDPATGELYNEALTQPFDLDPDNNGSPTWGHYETISAAAGRVGVSWTQVVLTDSGSSSMDIHTAIFDGDGA